MTVGPTAIEEAVGFLEMHSPYAIPKSGQLSGICDIAFCVSCLRLFCCVDGLGPTKPTAASPLSAAGNPMSLAAAVGAALAAFALYKATVGRSSTPASSPANA